MRPLVVVEGPLAKSKDLSASGCEATAAALCRSHVLRCGGTNVRICLTIASVLSKRASTSVRCLEIHQRHPREATACWNAAIVGAGAHFRVNGVRACFSYRQCRRYLMHKSHVGRARLQRAFLRRHSLQAWSEDPIKDMSNRGSSSTVTSAGSVPSATGFTWPLCVAGAGSMMNGGDGALEVRASEVDCHLRLAVR